MDSVGCLGVDVSDSERRLQLLSKHIAAVQKSNEKSLAIAPHWNDDFNDGLLKGLKLAREYMTAEGV